MILENTPYKVIIKTMHEEREKVRFFVEKESNKICKMHYRDSLVYYSTYTHPVSKNTYMFWGGKIVTPAYFQKIGNKNFRAGSCLMINHSSGERSVISLGKKNLGTGEVVDAMIIYTGHFFSRYRERAGYPSSIPTNELISTYFIRNCEYIPLDYEQVSKRKMDGGVAAQNYDGISLGTECLIEEDGYKFYVLKNNTFLPKTLLKENQENALMTKEKIDDIIAENMIDIVKKNPILSQMI